MGTAQSDKIAGALWGAVIGDALGALFEGMSKAHVHTVFKRISEFIDPLPGLKGKEERWKKPGLYTAPSQMMLLFGIAKPWRKKSANIPSLVARAASIGEGKWGVFRHPDILLRDYIERCRTCEDKGSFPDGFQRGMIPPSIFLPLLASPPNILRDSVRISTEFARLFTTDEYAIASAAIAAQCALHLIEEDVDQNDLLACIIDCAQTTIEWFSDHTAELFSMRINPESFIEKARLCAGSLESIQKAQSIEETEKSICAHAATHYPHAITRASINHPLLAFPFACAHFCFSYNHAAHPIMSAAAEGGASGVLASIAGIFSGAHAGAASLPHNLRESLINKNEIDRLIAAICENRHLENELDTFIKSEAALTKKEIEEHNAKLKHVKHKEKKKTAPSSPEEKLTRHVVESWTKLDKAKWKKQKKKHHGE